MITTDRLDLRPLQVGDGSQIAAAVNETWDDLSAWMRWATDRAVMTNAERSEEYAAACHTKFQNKTDFTFGGFLKDSGDLALVTRLYPREAAIGYYNFGGYWVQKKYQGQGLMTEAVGAVIDFAFDTLSARRFEIVVADTNTQSIAVIKRCGFQEEARLKNAHRLPNDTAVDELVFVRFK
jgi:RimJ/RimL family protein N-acetyltransferase